VVDLAPDDAKLHRRLAAAYERAGMSERACAHRVTLAELDEHDPSAVARAVRCLRGLGRDAAANRALAAAASDEVRSRASAEAGVPPADERQKGQLVIDASWDGPSDLDVSVVTPQGGRLSWLGGRVGVFGAMATAAGRERLGLARLSRGNYLIEVSRSQVGDQRPVRGTIDVSAHGKRRRLSFELVGDHATVGRIRVARRWRLVPDGRPAMR
jgi:hypothetical protein